MMLLYFANFVTGDIRKRRCRSHIIMVTRLRFSNKKSVIVDYQESLKVIIINRERAIDIL